MSKSVAFFDIDGVIYDGHTIFDVIRDQEDGGLFKTSLWERILEDLESYKSGKKSYKDAANGMLANYASFLKGLKYSDVLNSNRKFVELHKEKFFGYFARILPKLKKTHHVFLVTTNFQFTTEAVSKVFGIDHYLCSEAEVKKGVFTGALRTSLAGNKKVVEEVLAEFGRKGSIAVGDSENDIDMLREVEFPAVFEPDNKLNRIANENGWLVIDRDSAYNKILDLI